MIDFKTDEMISRSALLKKLEKEHESIRQIYYSLIDYVDKAICKGELGTYARVKRMVEEAPAVDAVEVVRCRDCKYIRPEVDAYTQEVVGCWCSLLDLGSVQDEHFCSYGERREENAAS